MKRLVRSLYAQVIFAVIVGAALGQFYPEVGARMKPLGDGFIKLVKMLIAPIVFATVVTGIAKMGDLRKVGRVGLKGIVYFEVLSTIALVIGLAVGTLFVPGAGMNVDPSTLDLKAIASYTAPSAHLSTVDFILNIIPKDVADAFARGEILQVLFFAILFGVALASVKTVGKPVLDFIDGLSSILFKIVGIVMRVAPIGAFGAMAFTIGRYGLATLVSLAKLIACFYATSILFVCLVLGAVMLLNGLNIFKFLRYIKEEILIVLGTAFLAYNWFASMKKGAVAGNDPWGGATLEWMIPSPPPDYNFATIPIVTSRYPLWDRKAPRLSADVSHGSEPEGKIELSLVGQRAGSVAVPSDTKLNAATAHPSAKELGIVLPTPTIKPLIAAFALGSVFIGVIMHKNLPIMLLGAAVFVLSLYNWLLTPLEPEHH